MLHIRQLNAKECGLDRTCEHEREWGERSLAVVVGFNTLIGVDVRLAGACRNVRMLTLIFQTKTSKHGRSWLATHLQLNLCKFTGLGVLVQSTFVLDGNKLYIYQHHHFAGWHTD